MWRSTRSGVTQRLTTSNDQATESAWLDYAWRIVGAADWANAHVETCFKRGGAPRGHSIPSEVANIRLPGHIGANYRAGEGLLLVGVAYKVAEVSDPVFLPAFEAARKWRAKGRSKDSDEAFLSATRTSFEASIQKWPNWERFFRPTLETLGLDLSRTAYTTAAKCWYTWRDYGDRNLAKSLAAYCNSDLISLQSLVEVIKPRQVYLAAASAPHPTASGETKDVFVMNFTYRSVAGLDPWPDWLTQVKLRYARGTTS